MSVMSAKDAVIPELGLGAVEELLRHPAVLDDFRLTDILAKARSLAGLELAEAAALLR